MVLGRRRGRPWPWGGNPAVGDQTEGKLNRKAKWGGRMHSPIELLAPSQGPLGKGRIHSGQTKTLTPFSQLQGGAGAGTRDLFTPTAAAAAATLGDQRGQKILINNNSWDYQGKPIGLRLAAANRTIVCIDSKPLARADG